MSPRYRGRQAVFIGTPPDDWSPTSFWSVPPSLVDLVCYERNVSMLSALGFARTHNKRELQIDKAHRKWAIVSRHLRARRPGEHPDSVAKRRAAKGGDA